MHSTTITALALGKTSCAALAVTMVLSATTSAQVYRVDDDVMTPGNGSSWASAFDNLDSALAAAGPGSGGEIWIAAGRYKPTVLAIPGDPRSAAFQIPLGVHVYGEFDGSEGSVAQRAGLFTQTILSGDIGVNGDASDNAYHVVRVKSGVLLDGMKVTDGNANGTTTDTKRGGGIWFHREPVIGGIGTGTTGGTLEIKNCEISYNAAITGGGIAFKNLSQLKVSKTAFYDNVANQGGAVWCHTARLTSHGNTYARNNAVAGGAVFVNGNTGSASDESGTAVRFVNDLYFDNSANRGGAAHLASGQQTAGDGRWKNCTFALNTALGKGGAINAAAPNGRAFLYNSIVWFNTAPVSAQVFGNAQITYTNIEGGAPGIGNIRKDPNFVNQITRDFHLQPGSKSNDAGDNGLVPQDVLDLDDDGDTAETISVDLDGNTRFTDDPSAPDTGSGLAPIVDQGAYELPIS